VMGLPPLRHIEAGSDTTCAITRTDELYCWGGNAFGQVGDGTRVDRLVPVRIALDGVQQVATGVGHACALMGPDDVRCWGRNSFGQIGDGTMTEATSPTPTTGLTGISALSTDDGLHTCAIGVGGMLSCWGNNYSSQLGLGHDDLVLTPTEITGLPGVSRVAVNSYHSCAIRSGGQLYCWGDNENGRLGDGSSTTRQSPVLISLASATRVALGRYATCAATGLTRAARTRYRRAEHVIHTSRRRRRGESP